MLHGYPSTSMEYNTGYYELFKSMNFQALAIDQPGCGESPGKFFSSRSDKCQEKDGPCDVVNAVMGALNI